MARGKRKAPELTPEERLEQALVPESKQPYPVPENWCWISFEDISRIRTGKKDANYGNENGQYPFFTCAAEPIRCDGYSFDCNAILLAGNGDINNISRYEGKFEAYQRTYVVETHQPVNIDLLYYYFKYRWFDYNKDKMFGTAIPYIRLGNLQAFPIPLPPLTEQRRIVYRIESLFAKLDEAKEKVQTVLDNFETRKAAILHKAFTGELTTKWRAEHGVGIESWVQKALPDVCLLRSGTTIPVDEELSEGKIPYIKVADMNLLENSTQITNSSRFVNTSPKSHIIPYGSTIFPKRGGAIFTNKKRFIGVPQIIADLNIMAIIPFREIMHGRYGYYWMLSIDLRELNNGSNVPQINNKDMVKLVIPMPTIEEQVEIVNILDTLFAKEQQAKEAAEAVLAQIDLMKKAILARAFRGELGTNDPAEESAVELVKNII